MPPASNPGQIHTPEGFWERTDVLAALHARDIGALFRLVRQYAGRSQQHIGAAVDMGQPDVSRLMRIGSNGRQVTSQDVLTRIADGLNMPDHARAALGLAPLDLTAPATPPRPSRAWNTADITRLRTTMIERGRTTDEIAAEIRILTRCSPLAAYRMAHGWSQPQAVEQYNRIAGHGYLDQPSLSRLERFPLPSDPRSPQAAQLVGLAKLYGTAALCLVPHDAIDLLDPQERMLLLELADTHERGSRPATPDLATSKRAEPPTEATQSASAGDEEDAVHRRTVLYGLVGAFGGRSAVGSDRLEAVRRDLDSGLDAGTSVPDVDEWERVAYQYAHDVGLLPHEKVLPELLVDLDEMRARLSISSDSVRTDLAHAISQLSALVAITLLNLDEPLASRRYWRTAIHAADQTHDQPLRALIRGRRAVFALYDQRSASMALTLADEAITAATGTSCAGAASGYAARAQALALLGQHGEARNALHSLTRTFAKLSEATVTDRASQWGWSEQRLRHVESHVYSHAGDIKNATKAQDQARLLYPSQLYQGPTQIELHRAICLINSGDPSEGARHVVRTLTALPAPVRRDAIVRRTAALALDGIPDAAIRLPAVAEARALLALPPGPA
jgi:transcriptional regulator with XRE-family HTH domain